MDSTIVFERLDYSELRKLQTWKVNKPCFCESGRKFKKCCWEEFEIWKNKKRSMEKIRIQKKRELNEKVRKMLRISGK